MFQLHFVYRSLCLVFILSHLAPAPHFIPESLMSYNSPVCVTATRQFSNLNTIPISFFLTLPLSRFSPTRHMFLFTLILLYGDVHMNPGPVSAKFNLCTLNIRSMTNPVHYTALSDLVDTYNIDLFALSETWISPSTTAAELVDAIPPGFSLISNPRPVSTTKISSIVCGGTAFLIRHPNSLISPLPTVSALLKFQMLLLNFLNTSSPFLTSIVHLFPLLNHGLNLLSLTFLKIFRPSSVMLLLFLMTLLSLVTSIFMLMTCLILILSSSCLFSA
jgi:hypothetical protein